jgi:tetratricopeptide (TPR) repeat protein
MNATYSEVMFIGRESEIDLFKSLGKDGSAWILNVIGEGGTGKTRLLLEYIDSTEKAGDLVTQSPIDLYLTTNKLERGILRNIAEQLGGRYFKRFSRELARDEGSTDALEDIRDAFILDYSQLGERRVVLVFDTSEESSESARRFLRATLPLMKQTCPQTMVVIAGRPKLPSGLDNDVVSGTDHDVRELKLGGLKPHEMAEFFRRSDIRITPELLERVAQLTQGRPILIALIVDWLNQGNTVESLLDYDPIDRDRVDKFEQDLVSNILKLQDPEDRAILAMAHFYKRCDEDMLAFILHEDKGTASNLVQSLQRFSFVKYRIDRARDTSSCLLHDEMRRLVNTFVWPKFDPLEEYRKDWSCMILAYYDKLISREQDPLERQNLSIERLFYDLRCDPKTAFSNSRELYRTVVQADAHEEINTAIDGCASELTQQMRHEHELRKATALYYERSNARAASEILTRLLKEDSLEVTMAARARVILVEALAEMELAHEAIQLSHDSEAWIREQEERLATDSAFRDSLETLYGELLTNRGLATRRLLRIDDTVKAYGEALKHFSPTRDGDAVSIAKVKTQRAYAYHLQGHHQLALSDCQSAVRICETISEPVQLGYAYNVWGIVQSGQLRDEEAARQFAMALEVFSGARHKRGIALVNLAHAQMISQTNWYRNRPKGKYEIYYRPTPEQQTRTEYVRASAMFDAAIRILAEIPDYLYLCEALNDKGVVLRRQGIYLDALKTHREGLQLAQDKGFRHFEAESLRNIAVVHLLQGQNDIAWNDASKALDIAKGLEYRQSIARSQRVLADICFQRKDYSQALELALDSCRNILQRDQFSLNFTPNRKEAFFDDWASWIADMVLALPTWEVAQEKGKELLFRWSKLELGEDRSSLEARIQNALDDYVLVHKLEA